MPSDKRDPNLREKLACERDGILMWSLDGLRRLLDGSYVFTETERTRAELMRYKIESNSALMYLDECCEVDETAECIRDELFGKYREYCIKNGFKSMSQTNFNKDVEAFDERIRRATDKVGRRRTWRGLRSME